jgi:hypothetical protein
MRCRPCRRTAHGAGCGFPAGACCAATRGAPAVTILFPRCRRPLACSARFRPTFERLLYDRHSPRLVVGRVFRFAADAVGRMEQAHRPAFAVRSAAAGGHGPDSCSGRRARRSDRQRAGRGQRVCDGGRGRCGRAVGRRCGAAGGRDRDRDDRPRARHAGQPRGLARAARAAQARRAGRPGAQRGAVRPHRRAPVPGRVGPDPGAGRSGAAKSHDADDACARRARTGCRPGHAGRGVRVAAGLGRDAAQDLSLQAWGLPDRRDASNRQQRQRAGDAAAVPATGARRGGAAGEHLHGAGVLHRPGGVHRGSEVREAGLRQHRQAKGRTASAGRQRLDLDGAALLRQRVAAARCAGARVPSAPPGATARCMQFR